MQIFSLTNKSAALISSKRGFALVMALSLLSLVFLLVISLVNLVGIDLSLADARKEKVLAQAHARMGMMVAIGELQKHLGPDTRISATADILDERIESGKKYETEIYTEDSNLMLSAAVPKNQAIDLNENGELDTVPFGQRYWTGVWKHRSRRKGVTDDRRAAKPLPWNSETADSISSTAMNDTEYDPHPAIEVAWLVSGNEGWSKKLAFMQSPSIARDFVEIPDGIPRDQRYFTDPNGGIYGTQENAWLDYEAAIESYLKNYDHPLTELDEPSDSSDTVWILKRPLLEGLTSEDSSSDEWKSKLRNEPVKVRKTYIRALDPASDSLNTHGSYAYWVGDQGVKAKINIYNPLKELSDEQSKIDDLTVAIEPNLSISDTSDSSSGPGIGGFGLSFEDDLQRVKVNSLSFLPKNDALVGEESVKKIKLASHYHSLTTDSYGVLSDTRTGGLKRDLSHAFSNTRDWDASLEQSTFNWIDDFIGYIYKDRVHYLKSVPMEPNAKANKWNDTAATESINDYNAILSGPLWRTLGAFHNMYTKFANSSGQSLVRNETADALPRTTGDNMVLFNSASGAFPNSRSSRPFWTKMVGVNPVVAVNTRLNYFRTLDKRPGPKNHPIQPVLLEFKYSQIPTVSGGNLALAINPSVALWNPYNVKMEVSQLFVEIPIHSSTMSCFNPKEFDRWRKWYMYNWRGRNNNNGGGGGATPPPPPPPPPPGWKNFIDLNGNGRRDPGEPSLGGRGAVGLPGSLGPAGHIMHMLPGRLWGNYPPFSLNDFARYLSRYEKTGPNVPPEKKNMHNFPPSHPWRRVASEFRQYSMKYDGFSRFGILHSNNPLIEDTSNPRNGEFSPVRERHLLLRIDSLSLDPGEKGHFTVAPGQFWNWVPLPDPQNNDPKHYLEVSLRKGNEQNSFLCRTNYSIDPSEPLAVENTLNKIQGVHPNQLEFFNPNDAKSMRPQGNYPESKGITMYTTPPYQQSLGPNLHIALAPNLRTPIFKISKEFDINAGIHNWAVMLDPIAMLSATTSPAIQDPDFLPGNGLRIRFQLPGNAEHVVLEEFNLRALVQSYQEGFGDNWQLESFIGDRFGGAISDYLSGLPAKTPRPEFRVQDSDTLNRFRPPAFAEFYELPSIFDVNVTVDDFVEIDPPRLNRTPPFGYNPYNLGNQIVPRVKTGNSSVGFFHDLSEAHGSMSPENRAVLFDIPSAPMLSMLQFRHANLSNYTHGPSYILGNSYANPQVGRYKSWGRVRTVLQDPVFPRMDIANNWASSTQFLQAYQMFNYTKSPWTNYISRMNLDMPQGSVNYGTIRKVEAQIEHQNTTLDHSYYANRALLDGYFLSGVGHDKWIPQSFEKIKADMAILSPGTPYSPYRNPRLKLTSRNGILSETSYGDLSDEVTSSEDRDFRYQTLAADLLLEGAFNINSTSVDAWISYLASLKGKKIPNGTYPSNQTPVPRFLKQPTPNSWNELKSLSDDEITLLAHCLVEQIKLRGPFLSFADFTNRRIQGVTANLLPLHFSQWGNVAKEDRDSVIGLRGAVQAAIAESEINQGGFSKYGSGNLGDWPDNPMIPEMPLKRYLGSNQNFYFRPLSTMNFVSSIFGLHAISQQAFLHPAFTNHTTAGYDPNNPSTIIQKNSTYGSGMKALENIFPGNWQWSGNTFGFKVGYDDYSGAFGFGEAPDNLLAVENVATAANKPGWVMQSDILSPIAPVSSVRSDTFVIRVMGEPKSKRGESKSRNRAWIELTVQRTPDYVKADLDAPHHRPHEPFEDRNFNGYWDNDPSFREHWLDLNQNGLDTLGEKTLGDAVPDLPGVGKTGRRNWYADGLPSDLKLNADPEEEPVDAKFSRMGINQRFGRKFKIIKFRWIKEQDV